MSLDNKAAVRLQKMAAVRQYKVAVRLYKAAMRLQKMAAVRQYKAAVHQYKAAVRLLKIKKGCYASIKKASASIQNFVFVLNKNVFYKNRVLSLEGKNIIAQGKWLEDIHMEHFYHLLKSCSDYRSVSTFQCYNSDTILSISESKKHIQILHSSDFDLHSYESGLLDLCLHELLNVNGHWVCSYYDTRDVYIYDSSNKKKLHKHHEQFLRRLFPFYSFDKKLID